MVLARYYISHSFCSFSQNNFSSNHPIREQIHSLAHDVLISSEKADERVLYLAGAIFQSLFEALHSELRRTQSQGQGQFMMGSASGSASVQRAEALLKRAFVLCKHPLVAEIELHRSSSSGSSINNIITENSIKSSSGDNDKSIKTKDIGVKMVMARMAMSSVMELMRFVEGVRQRLAQVSTSY